MPERVHLANGTSLQVDFRPNGHVHKVAVCLHPWSWLGGQMDDPVLLSLLEPLKEKGFTVLRYNSRGVGQSTGWASFSGFSEVKDLELLVEWIVARYSGIRSIAFIGYSHGSLIASLHPIVPALKTYHIFISYPLGPRGWLTLFHTNTYASRLKELVQKDRSNVLLLYGTQDEFTAASKYEVWAKSLASESKGNLKIVEINDASHFWRGRDNQKLVEAVLEWLP